MSAQRTLSQFFRYAVVGLASNALLYFAYLGLTFFGMGSKLAMSVLYVLGVLQTFVFNRRWTFAYIGGRREALFRYCASYGGGYVVNLAALYFLVDVFGFPHQIVQACMIVLVAVMLFMLQKLWVFPEKTT